MKVKRLQNRIAENRFSLPVTALIASLVWISTGLITQGLWVQFGLMIVSTYFMVELNNQNALMRTYSRMVSCALLVLILINLPLYAHNTAVGIIQLCFILHLRFLFHSYQDKRSMGSIFFAFTMLGICSLFFIQILYLVPIIWYVMGTRILSMTGRSFFASIIGLLLPYWCIAGFFIYQGNGDSLIHHIQSITVFKSFSLENLPSTPKLIAMGFITLMGITGSIHFLRNSYLDKIRTRMLYEALIILFSCVVLFIILQPQHIDMITPILITLTAPLIAHYITFTHSFLTNLSFIILIFTTTLLIVLNLWQPLLTFLYTGVIGACSFPLF